MGTSLIPNWTDYSGSMRSTDIVCPKCHGTTRDELGQPWECECCSGTGKIKEEASFEVKVDKPKSKSRYGFISEKQK